MEWQRGLRRQFGRKQAFGFENLGTEPFFSEFRVSNPVSKSSYRVVIRGLGPGGNFCSCRPTGPVLEDSAGENIGAAEMALASADGSGATAQDASLNPWQALAHLGAQFVAALASASNSGAAAHPWIERDPASGTQSLKIPLPPPEIAGQLANALSVLANSLRGKVT